LIIVGTGGSGTRVFAQCVQDLGYFMGLNLNASHDAMDLAGFNQRWRVRMLPGQQPLDEDERRSRQADFAETILRHRAGIPDPTAPWGYKHPRDIFMLPFLLEQFPGMRLLHVIRDGLDMAFSDNQHQLRDYGPAWLDPSDQALEASVRSAMLWDKINQLAGDQAQAGLGPRYQWMRFEDLCQKPEASLRRLESFCGRAFGQALQSALARISPPETLGRSQRQDPALRERVAAACAAGRTRFGYQAPAQTDAEPMDPTVEPAGNPDAQPGPARSWIVLGMHRSGTSLLACLLNQMGGYSGPAERLLSGSPENPLGFFEHQDMLRINNDLLTRRDSAWPEPPRVPQESWQTPDLEDLRNQAREFLARDFCGKAIAVFKDPRLCLTLGFWAGLLAEPRVLLCLRRPSSVAMSLRQRNGLDEEYSRWLWARHVRGALDVAGALLAGAVFYEELLANPAKALAPWASALGFESFLASAEARQAFADFVRPEFNHAPAANTDDLDRSYESLRLGPRDLAGLAAGLRKITDPILDGIPERPSATAPGFSQLRPQTAAWWLTQKCLRARLTDTVARAEIAEQKQRFLEERLSVAQRELELCQSERQRTLVRIALKIEKLRRGEP
jgi:hypothetical protein